MFYIEEIKSRVRENEQKFIVQFERENKELLDKIKVIIDERVEKLERYVYFRFQDNKDIAQAANKLNMYFNLKGFKTTLNIYSFTIYWWEDSFNIEDYIKEIASECVIES